MTETPFHSHPCMRCQQPVVCEGTLETTRDGKVICPLYHVETGVIVRFLCEACADRRPGADA